MDDACSHAAAGHALFSYPMFFDGTDVGLAVAGLNFPGYAAYADAPAEGKTRPFPLWVAATFASVDPRPRWPTWPS